MPRCVVPYRLVRLCTITFYGTTVAPTTAALLLFLVVLILVEVAAWRDGVPDADDTKLVMTTRRQAKTTALRDLWSR